MSRGRKTFQAIDARVDALEEVCSHMVRQQGVTESGLPGLGGSEVTGLGFGALIKLIVIG
ncbi:MAG: hypothetical protein WA089_01445 [Anaerolineae bacterium]